MHYQVYVLGECGELSWVRELSCVHAHVFIGSVLSAIHGVNNRVKQYRSNNLYNLIITLDNVMKFDLKINQEC